MIAGESITLKEVQLRLGVPQHVLIHLCEKGVIEPEFAETTGRGKRREFSERNVFEFGIALALRRLELPVAMTGFLVRVLRSFTRAMAKAVPGFELPAFLVDGGMRLRLFLYDDGRIVFAAEGEPLRAPMFVGARLPEDLSAPAAIARLQKQSSVPGSYDARVEVDLGQIARKVAK